VDRALPPERGLPSWGVVVAAAPKGYSTFFRNGLQHRTPDHFFSGPLIFFLIRFFKWRIICADYFLPAALRAVANSGP
jgi:hypothetical protein